MVNGPPSQPGRFMGRFSQSLLPLRGEDDPNKAAAGAEKSDRMAADNLTENLAPLVPRASDITAGEVLIVEEAHEPHTRLPADA